MCRRSCRSAFPKISRGCDFFLSANHTEAEIRGVIHALRDMPPVTAEAHQIVAAAMAGISA